MTDSAKAILMADVIPSSDDRFTVLDELTGEGQRWHRHRLDKEPLIKSTDPKQMPPLIAKAFHDCRVGIAPWPLFIYGGVGCGKSRFALLAHYFYGGKRYEFSELVGDYRLCKLGDFEHEYGDVGHTSPRATERTFRRMLELTRILIVDDIGASGNDSAHTRETLMLALNARVGGKPAVFISNLSPTELASMYDDRVASRMMEGTVCNMKNATDLRVTRCEVRQ